MPWLSLAKLRGSYGITGNDQIADYGYLETYGATSQPYQDGSGLVPIRIANADYSWETNKKLELNLDAGLFSDRLVLSVAWYRNRSSNQLVGYPLPVITGFSSVQYNLPATVQNTGWEFELNSINLREGRLQWSTNFNLTLPKNKLIDYPNIAGSAYVNTYKPGESLYSLIAYAFNGVNPTNGLYTFEDFNNNGNLDAGDRQTITKPLTSYLYGGLNNTLSFRNFNLSVFVQFAKKRSSDPLSQSGSAGFAVNQPVEVLGRWQKSGDLTDLQKFSRASGIGSASQLNGTYLPLSDRIVDASFLRIKNVSLSWDVPVGMLSKIHLKRASLLVQGQNLWTITNYLADPEMAVVRALPTLRTITAGIQITL